MSTIFCPHCKLPMTELESKGGVCPACDGSLRTTEPEPVYSAEDVLVRPYGEMAALTFRLVARAADGSVQTYRNSGTFLLRNGKWQAITWQATKVPPPGE